MLAGGCGAEFSLECWALEVSNMCKEGQSYNGVQLTRRVDRRKPSEAPWTPARRPLGFTSRVTER